MASLVACLTASTTNGHTTGLNPLSKEFLVAFCKRKVAIIMASSAMTHMAGSLHFFMDCRGVLALLLNLDWGELGMLSRREESGECLHRGSHSTIQHVTQGKR